MQLLLFLISKAKNLLISHLSVFLLLQKLWGYVCLVFCLESEPHGHLL